MYGSTSDVVHQSILDEVYHYPLSGPAPELFPETIALAQCFQVTPTTFISIVTDVCATEFALLEQLFVSDGSPTGR